MNIWDAYVHIWGTPVYIYGAPIHIQGAPIRIQVTSMHIRGFDLIVARFTTEYLVYHQKMLILKLGLYTSKGHNPLNVKDKNKCKDSFAIYMEMPFLKCQIAKTKVETVFVDTLYTRLY